MHVQVEPEKSGCCTEEGKRIKELEDELKIAKDSLQKLASEIRSLKECYEGLQSFTGTDVLPGHVKVLHMVNNPFTTAQSATPAISNSQGTNSSSYSSISRSGSRSSIPRDVLKELQRESRKLKEALVVAQTQAQCQSNTLNNSNEQDQMMLNSTGNRILIHYIQIFPLGLSCSQYLLQVSTCLLFPRTPTNSING